MPCCIIPGQLYLHGPLNEYIIVRKNERGYIAYSTEHNTTGKAWIESFIEKYAPVDPADLSEFDLETLCSKAPGITPKIGWYPSDDDDEHEFDIDEINGDAECN